ncbi:MAG: FeoA domain-containing protein [Methanophagales archaeon]|nr:FeoA domain-containing protein [Methanophagales archaeon]
MTGESDILRIVEEDILRILGEEKSKRVSLESIKSEIKVTYLFITNAIKELEREGLVQSQGDSIVLTKEGVGKAENIVKRHLVLENYFKFKIKRTRSEREAHKMTDILEHYISKEVIEHIKKLSTFKTEGFPLTKLALNKEGIITDILFPDYGLFERIVSMGIVPSEKIKVMYKIPDGMVIYVGGKKFALGNEIAKGIEVLS